MSLRISNLEKASSRRDKNFKIKIAEYSATFDRLEVQMESLQHWATQRLLAVHEVTADRQGWLETEFGGLVNRLEDMCDNTLAAIDARDRAASAYEPPQNPPLVGERQQVLEENSPSPSAATPAAAAATSIPVVLDAAAVISIPVVPDAAAAAASAPTVLSATEQPDPEVHSGDLDDGPSDVRPLSPLTPLRPTQTSGDEGCPPLLAGDDMDVDAPQPRRSGRARSAVPPKRSADDPPAVKSGNKRQKSG
jgi:hypothetical protein